jgi:hypothetical protein
MKIAIIVVILLGLDGNVEHKTTIEDECPDMNVLVTKLEEMKGKGLIVDYGAACLPAKFNEGIPL